jgi:hypothetical protein
MARAPSFVDAAPVDATLFDAVFLMRRPFNTTLFFDASRFGARDV